MSKTTEKLNEAEFFLKQVEANYLENPAFDYFLSAFISSARSVLWIMRSEYSDVDGWESWYKSLEPSTDDEALLRKINAARIRTEKQAPIKTNFRVSFIIPKEQITETLNKDLENLSGKTLEMTVRQIGNPDTPIDFHLENGKFTFIGPIEKVYRVLGELDDDDVLEACRKYYSTIKEIVIECGRLFE